MENKIIFLIVTFFIAFTPCQINPQGGYNQPQNGPYGAGYVQSVLMGAQPQQGGMWVCQNCGTQNSGKFCQGCGSPQPMNQAPQTVRCDKCGWMSQPGIQPPGFCPQCGDPIDFRNM